MIKEPGKAILLGVLICCLTYFGPQIFGGSKQFEAPFARSFLMFALSIVFMLLTALFVFDWLVPLDNKIRSAATSPRWSIAGFLGILTVGVTLIFTMITWNDERSNINAAMYLWQNGLGDYFENYGQINKWLGQHHPPLLVLVYGLWYKLVGFSLTAGRFFNLAFALGAAVIAYLWIKKASDHAIAGLSVICLLLFPMWCFSSASALLDMPFVFWFMASMLFFERYIQHGNWREAAAAGVFATITILCRYNGIFLFPIFFAQLFSHKSSRPLLVVPKTWLVIAVPVVLGMPWMVLSIIQGTFSVQFARLSEFLLVGLIRPGGWWYLSEVLLPLFPIMMGIFTIPLLFYGALSCWKVESASVRRILVACTTYLVLIALTLPNPRYVLPAVPMLAGIVSVGLWRLAANTKGMAVVLVSVGLTAAGFVAFYTWITLLKVIYIFY